MSRREHDWRRCDLRMACRVFLLEDRSARRSLDGNASSCTSLRLLDVARRRPNQMVVPRFSGPTTRTRANVAELALQRIAGLRSASEVASSFLGPSIG